VIQDLLSLFYELDYKASLLRDLRRDGKRKPAKSKKAIPATPNAAPNP
jgi:hypothetical protein